jgi:hypothetical protein
MSTTTDRLDGRELIPDLLRAAPQVRPVLDRYGLQGCGGPLGPSETLAFFARAHDVPLSQLVSELNSAAAGSPAPDESSPPGLADGIYRPFFKAGILVALTLGAAWGAYLLLRIGSAGSFRAAGLHEVNAHGHAQIFGWVGLFVMGFAYQAFPRFKHISLAHPRAAVLSLCLMLAGIVGRSVGEPLAAMWSAAGGVAIVSALVELGAIILFAGIVLSTWRASRTGLVFYDYFVLSSLFWFVVQAAGEAMYLSATLAASDREALIDLVGTWQPALRDVQIHGFAMLMILGVSQRVFHNFYGFPAPVPKESLVLLALLNLAIVGEASGVVLMRIAERGWSVLWYASVLLLAATVTTAVFRWRLFGRAGENDRSLKFLRTAYAWLLIALAMQVLLPVYQFVLLSRLAPDSEAVRIGFSHAYYGAVRHAITVGFISMMIVGVAAKVVPTLNGVDVHRLSSLWAPFLLLNAGCAMRVVAQMSTDLTPAAFPIAGASGLLEVTGLALWGIHLWGIMSGRVRFRRPPRKLPVPYAAGTPIAAEHRVGAVLDGCPELLGTFVALGFQPLTVPLLRRTVAPVVTVGEACRRLGLNTAEVLAILNRDWTCRSLSKYPLELVAAEPMAGDDGRTTYQSGGQTCVPPTS